jgi:hypothetical protein
MSKRFKTAFMVRFPDGKPQYECNGIMKAERDKQAVLLLKKKSLRAITKWVTRCGYNQDDFIPSMFICVASCFVVKVPRIVKNMLLK